MIWRGRTPAKVTTAVVVFLVTCSVLLAPNANAFVFVVPSPALPASTVVGQTFPYSVGIGNFSTPPQSTTDPILPISQIDLYPACTNSNTDCSGGTAEGGVFALSATGTGMSNPPGDPDCEGTWTLVPDTGNPLTAARYRLIPPGGEGTLTLATGETCAVSFTGLTLRVPTIDSDPAPGVQTHAVASSTATGSFGPLRNVGAQVTTVVQALSSTVGSEAWNSRDLKSRPH